MRFNILGPLLGLAISPWSTVAQDFSGRGQIRALHVRENHQDLGCLTSAGKWTTIETLCGDFDAQRVGNNNEFRLSSTGAGSCGIEGVFFKCGISVGIFGTWGTEGPVRGREVIRYGAYGLMASDGNNPPEVRDVAVGIHFSTGKERGKAVWLGWKAL
ncbi:hypothetical protein QBC40DRAFT_311252 [Triangularia verruculosa]|uniref:RNase T2-like C-terminal domain-containing protein n=1 Tax=Triangularia verruculosa TaxID=2587418 RepID=A0AAN6X8A5_9PEZI|nr:hypothetical protein QBC40DRAFT_311252 [Triangularia verruculosa]